MVTPKEIQGTLDKVINLLDSIIELELKIPGYSEEEINEIYEQMNDCWLTLENGD